MPAADKNYNTFELNGEDGSVFFDLEDPQWLQFFEYRTPDGRKIDSTPPAGARSTSPTSSTPTWTTIGCRA